MAKRRRKPNPGPSANMKSLDRFTRFPSPVSLLRFCDACPSQKCLPLCPESTIYNWENLKMRGAKWVSRVTKARPSSQSPAASRKSMVFLRPRRNCRRPPSGRGRLIFALDATMSRQATWDIAQSVQGRMFTTAAAHGGLDVQLVYYRGFSECKASRFVSGGAKSCAR